MATGHAIFDNFDYRLDASLTLHSFLQPNITYIQDCHSGEKLLMRRRRERIATVHGRLLSWGTLERHSLQNSARLNSLIAPSQELSRQEKREHIATAEHHPSSWATHETHCLQNSARLNSLIAPSLADRAPVVREYPSYEHEVYMESVGSVIINVIDFDQVKKVLDDEFMLKCTWPKKPSPSTQEEVFLLTKLINRRSDKFFGKVLSKIQKADVPAGVMRTLYNDFKLKLLGMTKELDVLMEGNADTVEEVMRSRSAEVQQELAQFVPEDQRGQIEWGEFLRVPVQCFEDLGLSSHPKDYHAMV